MKNYGSQFPSGCICGPSGFGVLSARDQDCLGFGLTGSSGDLSRLIHETPLRLNAHLKFDSDAAPNMRFNILRFLETHQIP